MVCSIFTSGFYYQFKTPVCNGHISSCTVLPRTHPVGAKLTPAPTHHLVLSSHLTWSRSSLLLFFPLDRTPFHYLQLTCSHYTNIAAFTPVPRPWFLISFFKNKQTTTKKQLGQILVCHRGCTREGQSILQCRKVSALWKKNLVVKKDGGYQRNKKTSLKRAPILAGWLKCLDRQPMHQKVAGSIPTQGTYLGCGFNPRSGCVWEGTDECSLSFILSTSLSIFLSKANEHILRWGLIKNNKIIKNKIN